MALQLKKEFKLDSFGWKECSLFFYAISYKEMMEMDEWRKKINPSAPTQEDSNKVFETLESKYVSGTVMDGEKKIELPKEQLKELPFEIIISVTNWLINGDQDKDFTTG